ncbi:aminotransferase class III-fold pyridoxal phosphate-dependent enzyme [Staphylococcus aureus]|uniref:aminotransferase class III-fold pyridoxal phosphate-dependent enzyme n=1 Tax=Staphylococcus aureus TaxID=1280 RepID=UPI001C12C32E|nr:aminotransferase class III-fold pyridoxal phosphate-dependent enzyme [Staphylococcus aureus]
MVQAVRDQLDRFTHTCHQGVPYESYVALAERLNAAVPGDWPKKTAFYTTGAEAVENAVKIARHYTGRAGVVAFSGGFHGRTYLLTSVRTIVTAWRWMNRKYLALKWITSPERWFRRAMRSSK